MANLVLYLWISEARETRSWSAGGVSFLLYCNLCTKEPIFNLAVLLATKQEPRGALGSNCANIKKCMENLPKFSWIWC